MYELTVKSHFDAAHALTGYPGECRDLHGHTWDVEATVAGETLDDIGIVYDFKDLKRDLAAVLAPLDHAYLNEVPPFDTVNPTAENLARELHDALEGRLRAGVRLVEIAVWESPVARIAYRR
jgi:6-pyruvoyltetrahydropterin/6-carboxytetrahydropterin synthase